jgi:5-methylcytosine-specific restriction protein A
MTLTRKPGSYLQRVPFPPRSAGLPRTPWALFVPGIITTQPCITGSRAGNSPAAESRATGAATKRAAGGSSRRESFSPAVAALIDARDPWCVHCGSPHDLQRHHRRIKGMGGDPRPHTDCACVGVRICLACHDWAHSGKGRREAEAEGLIIPRSTVGPWTLSVLVHLEDDRGGMRKYPSCDGRWLDETDGLAA